MIHCGEVVDIGGNPFMMPKFRGGKIRAVRDNSHNLYHNGRERVAKACIRSRLTAPRETAIVRARESPDALDWLRPVLACSIRTEGVP